jgi:hypothetical protein
MPNVRATDPLTSVEAAGSVVRVSETQQVILGLLRKPMTDEQLIEAYRWRARQRLAPNASESGIRSRRSELARLGLVQVVGDSVTQFGRRALVWGRDG